MFGGIETYFAVNIGHLQINHLKHNEVQHGMVTIWNMAEVSVEGFFTR